MYSLMSMRTMRSSSSNRNSARARASSVLPTPVGPRNRNEPIGRRGPSPAGLDGQRPRRPGSPRPADHALVQPVLDLDELGRLAFEEARDRDPVLDADDPAMSSR